MRDAVVTQDRIGAESMGSQAPPASYSGGRVCAQPSCGTQLSIYNPDAYCALHGSLPHAVARRRRRRSPGGGPVPVVPRCGGPVVLDRAS